jgi:hypothetical protein
MDPANNSKHGHAEYSILLGSWHRSHSSSINYTPAPRVIEYEEVASTKEIEDDVDVLDEVRDVALARATVYHQNLRNYHSPLLEKSLAIKSLSVAHHNSRGAPKTGAPQLANYLWRNM